MSSGSPDFSKLFEDAEKSVSVIKDEKLRQIAFDKLVTHLLSGASGGGEGQDPEERTPLKKSPTKPSAGKTSKKKDDQKTTKAGPKGYLTELLKEGFFSKPKSSREIREELEARSHHLEASDLTAPLQLLCHEKLLRRKKESNKEGGSGRLSWVNW